MQYAFLSLNLVYWPVDYDTDRLLMDAGRKLWVFPRFTGDCASGHKKFLVGTSSDQKIEITDSCSQMILQLHDVYDPNKVSKSQSSLLHIACGFL